VTIHNEKKGERMDKRQFKNPDNKYRVMQIIHGFDNLLRSEKGEKLSAAGAYLKMLETNLRLLQNLGVGGLVFNVSFKNYMKDEAQWKLLLDGIKLAEKHGFVLWLYDEEGYPSGEAGTLVLEADPEYQSIGLVRKEEENGSIKYEAQKTYDGTHATENVHAKRPYVNIINKNAIKKFIDLTHKEYAKRIPNLKKRVGAIFTDEPSLMTAYIRGNQQFPPCIPWVEDLTKIFKKKKGYLLELHLEKLFSGTGDEHRKVRCDFYDVVADLCAERYFGQIQAWCHKIGIKASGHSLCEENLIWHAYFYGDFYRSIRRYDLPGIDVLSSNPRNLIEGNGFITPKLVSSVSHVIGSDRTMSETSDHGERCAGIQVTVRQMIGTANLQYALGVNVITSYYGHFWKELKTNAFFSNKVNVSGPGGEYRKYCECVSRLGYMLTGGKHVCNAAVYYPIWGVLSNFYPTGRSIYEAHPDKTAQMVADEFTSVCRALLRSQVDFDILDDRAIQNYKFQIANCKLQSVKVKTYDPQGRLTTHDEKYSVIIIPPTDAMPVKTLKKLMKFVQADGKVVSVGMMPKYGAGMKDNDVEAEKLSKELFTGMGEFLPETGLLAEYLKKLEITDLAVEPANPDILYKHIYKGGKHIYFVTNISENQCQIDVTVPVKGMPSLWYPETGKIKKIAFKFADNRTKIKLDLKDYEGVFIVVQE